MNFIPEKLDEFKSHKHFILPSLLRRYQDLRPNSIPYKDYRFKQENIYLRKDIIHLHTVEQWRRLRRKIKSGETPLKITKGNYNDKSKMARLFAPWQTEIYHIKLNDDGTIPTNEYGNIEVFRPSDLPKGTTHLEIFGAKALCCKLGIEYKAAVTGFSLGSNGNHYPIIKGVVIHTKDLEKIMKQHKIDSEAREIRKQKALKTISKKLWKALITKICVKKYVTQLYDRNEKEIAEYIPMGRVPITIDKTKLRKKNNPEKFKFHLDKNE